MADENQRSLTQWAIAAVISVTVGFLDIQWQQAEDQATQNAVEIEKLEERHRTDIARLDESNRTRRNAIADLEERVARLEERTSE